MLLLLDVRHLTVKFPTRGAAAPPVTEVRDLSLTIAPREVLGLVGESGSGNAVTSLALIRLLAPQARVAGELLFASRNGSGRDTREIRGTICTTW